MTRFGLEKEDRSAHDVTFPSHQSLNIVQQVPATAGTSEDCSLCYHIFPKTAYARPQLDASIDAALIAWGGHCASSALKSLDYLIRVSTSLAHHLRSVSFQSIGSSLACDRESDLRSKSSRYQVKKSDDSDLVENINHIEFHSPHHHKS